MTAAPTLTTPAWLHWQEADAPRQARWRSERGAAPAQRVVLADDTLAADEASRLANAGTALLWCGDFQNARLLMQAMQRRADRVPRRKTRPVVTEPAPEPAAQPQSKVEAPGAVFHRHRLAQSQRARLLGQILIELGGDYGIALRRAPDWRAACTEAWGEADGEPSVVSLRELLGVLSAHEWRKKGVPIPSLGAAPDNRIHAHYGVFSPLRGEYLDLVAAALLPVGAEMLAFDIGTGTGVIAALLARRGVARVIATDCDARALACAADNLQRLGLSDRVELLATDLFPPGRAALVVCNPPWLPARPGSPLERAIYDEDGAMLRGFLDGLAQHLLPQGEGWLILSDLAERLGLRESGTLASLIAAAGLQVLGRSDIWPRHPKASDAEDPLHEARRREVTTLWRLGVAA